jgi:hypothetical protein
MGGLFQDFWICGEDSSSLSDCFEEVTVETTVNILFLFAFPFVSSLQNARNSRHRATMPAAGPLGIAAEVASLNPTERLLSCTEFQWFMKLGFVGSLITTDAVNLYYQIKRQLEFPLATPHASSELLEALPFGAYLVGVLSILANALCLYLLLRSRSTVRLLPPLPAWWCIVFMAAIFRAFRTVTLVQLKYLDGGAVLVCMNAVLSGVLAFSGVFDLIAWARYYRRTTSPPTELEAPLLCSPESHPISSPQQVPIQ